MGQRQKLLILDLDETLIHATEKPLNRDAVAKVGPYYVYLRPFLAPFLDMAFATFQVATWTSSTQAYNELVLPHIFGERLSELAFSWDRRRCTWNFFPETQSYFHTKNLKKLKRRGFDLSQVLAVDDDPEKYFRTYGNLVRVRAFEGEDSDDELIALTEYLPSLAALDDVRTIEKRGWRTHATSSSLAG